MVERVYFRYKEENAKRVNLGRDTAKGEVLESGGRKARRSADEFIYNGGLGIIFVKFISVHEPTVALAGVASCGDPVVGLLLQLLHLADEVRDLPLLPALQTRGKNQKLLPAPVLPLRLERSLQPRHSLLRLCSRFHPYKRLLRQVSRRL